MDINIGEMSIGDILGRSMKLLFKRLPYFYAIQLIVVGPTILLQLANPFLPLGPGGRCRPPCGGRCAVVPATDLVERLTSASCPVWRPPPGLTAPTCCAPTRCLSGGRGAPRGARQKLAAFARFCNGRAESGQMINYAAISARPASAAHGEQLLRVAEDMFTGFRVTAFSGSPRKSLLSTERFSFSTSAYAMRRRTAVGSAAIRRIRAGLRAVGRHRAVETPGISGGGKLHYLRTKAGAEVDFIIARRGRLIP